MRGGWLAVVMVGWCMECLCMAGSVMLFDFENGVEGWEHDAPGPVTPEHATDRARSGRGSVAFTYQFGWNSRAIHCRTTTGFPTNMAAVQGFRGLSSWVFIPNGKPVWEARMFVHCGERWVWNEGPMKKSLQPGWNRLEIPMSMFTDASDVRDVGVQISNPHQTIESRILIDRVEMMTSDAPP